MSSDALTRKTDDRCGHTCAAIRLRGRRGYQRPAQRCKNPIRVWHGYDHIGLRNAKTGDVELFCSLHFNEQNRAGWPGIYERWVEAPCLDIVGDP